LGVFGREVKECDSFVDRSSSFHYVLKRPNPICIRCDPPAARSSLAAFPMEAVPSDNKDQHHRGLWLGYKEINGFDFWENNSRTTIRRPESSDARIQYYGGDHCRTLGWLGPTAKRSSKNSAR